MKYFYPSLIVVGTILLDGKVYENLENINIFASSILSYTIFSSLLTSRPIFKFWLTAFVVGLIGMHILKIFNYQSEFYLFMTGMISLITHQSLVTIRRKLHPDKEKLPQVYPLEIVIFYNLGWILFSNILHPILPLYIH
jgi:hypothetical protein